MTRNEFNRWAEEKAREMCKRLGMGNIAEIHTIAALVEAYEAGRRDMGERAAAISEAERQQILKNSDDPSWTEHLAYVQHEIRAAMEEGKP